MRHIKKSHSYPSIDYRRFSEKYFPSRVTIESCITQTKKKFDQTKNIKKSSSPSSISPVVSASAPSSKLPSSATMLKLKPLNQNQKASIKAKKFVNKKSINERLRVQRSWAHRFATGWCHIYFKIIRRNKQKYMQQKLRKTLKGTSNSSKGTPSRSKYMLGMNRGESSGTRTHKRKLSSFEGRWNQLDNDNIESEKADSVVGEWSLSRFLAEIYPGKYPPWIRPTSHDVVEGTNCDSEMTSPKEVENIPRVDETVLDHTQQNE